MTWPSCLAISSARRGSCVGLVGKLPSTSLSASGKNCFPCSHGPWLSSSAPPPCRLVVGWCRSVPGIGSPVTRPVPAGVSPERRSVPGGGSPETLFRAGAAPSACASWPSSSARPLCGLVTCWRRSVLGVGSPATVPGVGSPETHPVPGGVYPERCSVPRGKSPETLCSVGALPSTCIPPPGHTCWGSPPS